MKVAIILFNVDLSKFNLDGYYKIGCDRGALNAINSNLKLDIALGDFDSVNAEELSLIEANSNEIFRLNPIKDKTDVEEALDIAFSKSNDVTIFGGISGQRVEHFLSIISLFSIFHSLKLIDNNSYIIYKNKSFKFKKSDYSDYMFVSIFPQSDELLISLSGFKYNLDNKLVDKRSGSLLVSNQMIKDNLEVYINSPIIIIFSKLDNSNNIA